jgi:prephenate dehydratase
MSTIHILGTSTWGRPTNTEHHLRELRRTHPELTQWDIVRADSNAKALETLLRSDPKDNDISLAPFYNVHGKWVHDTMKMIAENYTRLRLLHISRLSVDYILAYHNGASLGQIKQVVTHEQAILQTQKYWWKHWIPNNLQKTWNNNTAAWLDFLINNPNATDTIAISTPWQWRESDWEVLTRVDSFWPEDNHTYFGIFWLKDSDIWTIAEGGNTENPEWIEFWVIELEDSQWSLAHALENIAYNWKDIHSIMSFPQNNGKVIFVVAYSAINWEKTINPTTWKATISESYDKDNKEKPYIYRLSIPNIRWSLWRTLGVISQLVDIRSIESIWTSREDVDFIISIAPQTSDTNEILTSIKSILEAIEYKAWWISSSRSLKYTFNNLRN